MNPEDEKLLEKFMFEELQQHDDGYIITFVGREMNRPVCDFRRSENDKEICDEIDQFRLKLIKYLIKKGELKA